MIGIHRCPEPFGGRARLNLIVQGIETLAHDAAKNEGTDLSIVIEKPSNARPRDGGRNNRRAAYGRAESSLGA